MELIHTETRQNLIRLCFQLGQNVFNHQRLNSVFAKGLGKLLVYSVLGFGGGILGTQGGMLAAQSLQVLLLLLQASQLGQLSIEVRSALLDLLF